MVDLRSVGDLKTRQHVFDVLLKLIFLDPSHNTRCKHIWLLHISSWHVHCALQDDGSGRQQWVFTQTDNGYNIQILNGRQGCASYMIATSCANGGGVTFGASNATGQYASWSVTPGMGSVVLPVASLAPGQYQISSIGRSCANSYLGTQLCSQGNQSLMQPGGLSLCLFLSHSLSLKLVLFVPLSLLREFVLSSYTLSCSSSFWFLCWSAKQRHPDICQQWWTESLPRSHINSAKRVSSMRTSQA